MMNAEKLPEGGEAEEEEEVMKSQKETAEP